MKAVANAARRNVAVLRRLALPLGVYLGVTLVVPALNGAWRNAAFAEHAAEVLVTAAVFIAGVAGVATVALPRARFRQRCPEKSSRQSALAHRPPSSFTSITPALSSRG